MSDFSAIETHKLSIVFLASAFLIFLFGMFKALGYVMVSLFSLPYVDEDISAAFADKVTEITNLFNTIDCFDFILFGIVLFTPIVLLGMRFVFTLIEGKRLGDYEFVFPDGFCFLAFLFSSVSYSSVTGVSYMCSSIHYLTIDKYPEFLSTSYDLLFIPALMSFIAIVLFIGLAIASIIITIVHEKRQTYAPLTEEDIF